MSKFKKLAKSLSLISNLFSFRIEPFSLIYQSVLPNYKPILTALTIFKNLSPIFNHNQSTQTQVSLRVSANWQYFVVSGCFVRLLSLWIVVVVAVVVAAGGMPHVAAAVASCCWRFQAATTTATIA